MKNNLLIFTAFIFFTGCVDPATLIILDEGENTSKEMSEELQKVQEVFESIDDKDDKLLIYKLFAGSSEYLSNCETMQLTAAFDPILGKVQTSYGWDREKYPELTDAVSDYLVSVDYQEPKKLESSRSRRDFAKIFQNLAEVTKYE